jgi:4-hydroxy-3-methylbut-2-enyl diphosphate reductase
LEELKNEKAVGITAGASTPNWLINEVVDFLKSNTSAIYRLLKYFSFLSFLPSLNFTLLFLGLLSFLDNGLNIKNLYLTFSLFSFLMLKYNLESLQNIKSFGFYYTIKGNFLKNHRTLVKSLIVIFAFLCALSGFFYHPRILASFVVFLILNQIFLKTPFHFFMEPLILIGLALFFYPFWNLTFSLIFLQVFLLILFLRLYFEAVYFQTDGFLPENFLFSFFEYKENKIYRLMLITISLGAFFVLPLLYFNKFYIVFLIPWGLAYKLFVFLKRRPLGQIVYMENLSLILPLTFSLLSLLFK